MAKAGADIVGANCLFDPWINLETVRKMKVALDSFNQHPYLMAQPNAYRCPDCGPFGWLSLPEFPYGKNYKQNFYSSSCFTRGKQLFISRGNKINFLKLDNISAIEPRQITRFEAKQWARDAYNLGVR